MNERLVSLIALLLVFTAVGAEEWPNPKLLPPDSINPGNVAFKMFVSENYANISFDEEVKEKITIAKINYGGSSTPILIFPWGGNDKLGATVEKKEECWSILVNRRQDYEMTAMRSYLFYVGIVNESSAVIVNLNDLNDNTPVVTAIDPVFDVHEHWKGTTNCAFLVDDPDTVCSETDYKVYESGVESNLFSVKILQKSVCNKVLLFVVNEELDYETKNSYNLTIIAFDGPLNGSAPLMVEVIDDYPYI